MFFEFSQDSLTSVDKWKPNGGTLPSFLATPKLALAIFMTPTNSLLGRIHGPRILIFLFLSSPPTGICHPCAPHCCHWPPGEHCHPIEGTVMECPLATLGCSLSHPGARSRPVHSPSSLFCGSRGHPEATVVVVGLQPLSHGAQPQSVSLSWRACWNHFLILLQAKQTKARQNKASCKETP